MSLRGSLPASRVSVWRSGYGVLLRFKFQALSLQISISIAFFYFDARNSIAPHCATRPLAEIESGFQAAHNVALHFELESLRISGAQHDLQPVNLLVDFGRI